MSRFAIKTPYLIIVVCLIIAILGAVSVVQMPVDMFPSMNIPVVVVATFYAGMPPEQIEGDITYHLERFFTLASGIDHIESRSLNGVSIIRVYFQSNTNADIDAATIANLAVSDMKDLAARHAAAGGAQVRRFEPAGVSGDHERRRDDRRQPEGHRAELRSQSTGERSRRIHPTAVRRTLASDPVLCRSVYKLEARQISPMDVVRSLSQANVILPAGDVQIGNLDYNIYSNAQFNLKDASQYPVKMNGENPVLMSDVGQLKDAHALQYNVVHVNGQRSVYLPVMKQGGDSNTIAVVDGVRKTSAIWWMFPSAMKTDVVFDQSRFVRTAIEPCCTKAESACSSPA
jgi:multidrug efflux pump subunit AcrB